MNIFRTHQEPIPAPPGEPTLRQRLHLLTCQHAAKAGRIPTQVTQADYERAKFEVTGESDLDRQNAILDYHPSTLPLSR